MEIDFYGSGPYSFIELEGEMTADNCSELRERVVDALPASRCFVLKLKHLVYMDSTALGMLMSLAHELRMLDAEIKLVGLQEPLRRIFSLVGAERSFDIHDRTDEAVQAFGLGAGVGA